MSILNRLWSDEAGFVVSAELIFIATVLVIGLIVGLATVRDNVINELADVADAVSEVAQSFSFSGVTGHSASSSGTIFADENDFCETGANATDQSAGNPVMCLSLLEAAVSE